MDKEKWKDDVLNSLQGITPAEPNPFLFTRIEAAVSRVREITPRQWKIVVACGLILLLINGWTFFQDRRPANQSSPYELNNHNYQLY